MPQLKRMQHALQRAADRYDSVAVLPREVASRMIDRLALVKCDPIVGVEVGTRTGESMTALRARFPNTQWIATECTPALLTRAREKSSAQWVCADPLVLPIIGESVDILIAHALLPGAAWEEVLREYRRVLKPGGLCMFSTLGPDTLKELRACWEDRENLFTDMHLIGDKLLQAGFENPVMDVDHFTLRYPNVLSLLRELKALGSHALPRTPGLQGKQAWARKMDAYERYRTSEGKYPATFEVVYGHAWAAPPRAANTAREMTVPVSVLKRG